MMVDEGRSKVPLCETVESGRHEETLIVPDSHDDISTPVDLSEFVVPDSEEEGEIVVAQSPVKKMEITSSRWKANTVVYKRCRSKSVGVGGQSYVQSEGSPTKTICKKRARIVKHVYRRQRFKSSRTIKHVYRRQRCKSAGVGELSSIQSSSSARKANIEEHCGKELLKENITKMNSDVSEAASNHYETCNGEQDVSTPAHLSDLKIVSDIKSQEPEEEMSPEKALEFVDHFLSEYNLSTPPDQKINGGKAYLIKSPPQFSAKGALTLARRMASLSDKPKNLKVFDWNAEETTGFHSTKGAGIGFFSRSQEQTAEGDEGEVFGVGFDTQMAAEAMEALCHAPPPTTMPQHTHDSHLMTSPSMLYGEKSQPLREHSGYKKKCKSQKQSASTNLNKCRSSERLAKVPKNPVKSSRRSTSNNLDLSVPEKMITGKVLDSSSKTQSGGSKSSLISPSIRSKLDPWCYMKKKRTHRGIPRISVFSNSPLGKGEQKSMPGLNNCGYVQMDDTKALKRSLDGDFMVSKENVDVNVAGGGSNISITSEKPAPSILLAKDPNFLPKNSRSENVRVLFSQNLESKILDQQKKIVARLGFSVASSCSDATHFVTDRFVRTRNMLEAISLGKPVVTNCWLESCDQANHCVDVERYILRDVKKEKEIGFSMPATLASACKHPLLTGQRVFITPNVKPSLGLIKSLVESVHGKVVEKIAEVVKDDGSIPKDLLILSCKDDYAICAPLIKKGAAIHDSELLLNGIVIQKLEFERHRLFTKHAESSASGKRLRSK